MRNNSLYSALHKPAKAVAFVSGSPKHPSIRGSVRFFGVRGKVFVRAEITGLPEGTKPCASPIFAIHIHEGTECTGNETDAFANAGGHYNPYNCLHPYHAGDMPPLFGVNGSAFSAFLTDRFTIPEILGKALIIHASPDDFTTQPSGSSGEKIACGVITATGK